MHWSARMVALCEAKKPKPWQLVDLARESGVNVKLIYKYAEGAVDKPRGDKPARIAKALGVSEEFLIYGREDVGPNFPKVVLLTMNEIGTLRRGRFPRDIWDEVSVVHVPLKPDQILTEKAFAVIIPDNACSPNYLRGDQVICEPPGDDSIEPGKYVVAQIDETPTGVLRRYQPLSMTDKSTFKLVANDRFYPDIVVDAEHPGQILGRVVKLIRDSD